MKIEGRWESSSDKIQKENQNLSLLAGQWSSGIDVAVNNVTEIHKGQVCLHYSPIDKRDMHKREKPITFPSN